MEIKQIAEAFSKHDFKSTYKHIDEDVIWHLIGGDDLKGKEAVLKACDTSAEYLANVETTFLKFKTFVSDNTIIIDSMADYVEENGEKSTVSSCDIYEFEDGKLKQITSYTIELQQSK